MDDVRSMTRTLIVKCLFIFHHPSCESGVSYPCLHKGLPLTNDRSPDDQETAAEWGRRLSVWNVSKVCVHRGRNVPDALKVEKVPSKRQFRLGPIKSETRLEFSWRRVVWEPWVNKYRYMRLDWKYMCEETVTVLIRSSPTGRKGCQHSCCSSCLH